MDISITVEWSWLDVGCKRKEIKSDSEFLVWINEKGVIYLIDWLDNFKDVKYLLIVIWIKIKIKSLYRYLENLNGEIDYWGKRKVFRFNLKNFI